MQQGISARETCPDEILTTLLDSQLGFEQMVTKLSSSYARGTISKYLTEVFDKGYVDRKGRRGKYFLTAKGKKEAEKYRFTKVVSKLTPEAVEKLLKNYKLMIAYNNVLYYKEMIHRSINRRIQEIQIEKYAAEKRKQVET
jgi:predicted transcriptional regulator